ncbi:MAG: hypothetical protein OK449_02730 [Thaumarchaeota archaeon]|nr:hypothetical protein [Nitrososphaerota archaeon]
MNTWQTVGTIAVVALALGLALIVPAGPQSTSVSTTSSAPGSTATSSLTTSTDSSSTGTTTGTSTSGQQSTYANSRDGLQLRLSINSTTITTTGAIAVNVSEYNTLSIVNNVTESSGWQIQAALSSCPNTNVQPFGIAVYQGYYAAQNVSQGSQLQIFPITACPMFIRLVTGYVFQPQSDTATIQPGSGASPTSMTSVVTVTGTYAGLDQTHSLNPGVYTFVAADEWGALAFLYVTVQ